MFKRLFAGLIFGAAYFRKGFCVSKWVALDNKNSLKAGRSNSPCAYIWEGLLSEGYLHLRFGGLMFDRAFFSGGGGYYQDFTVF